MNYNLKEAIRRGDLDYINKLFNYSSEFIDVERCLYEAFQYGDLNVIDYFFTRGGDIHRNSDEYLINACHNGNFDVIKYLVERGSNIHANDNKCLKYVCFFGILDIVKYFVENGAEIDKYCIQGAQNNG